MRAILGMMSAMMWPLTLAGIVGCMLVLPLSAAWTLVVRLLSLSTQGKGRGLSDCLPPYRLWRLSGIHTLFWPSRSAGC